MDQEREPLPPSSIESLPEDLGFVETPELREMRDLLVESITLENDYVIRDIFTRYSDMAAEIVEQQEGEAYIKAQIGMYIRMALIRRDGGRAAHYIEGLQDAIDYAHNMNLDDIVAKLEAAIEAAEVQHDLQEIAEAEPTSGELAQACADVLTQEDCEELRAMPTDEALGYAFTLLLANGIEDPEEYLKDKNILE